MYLIYSPIGEADAARVARALVEEKLAACVNMMAPHKAVYWWQGQVEESSEVGLLLKTSDDRLEFAVARLKEIHPYETPVVVWWEVGATPEALAWLQEAVR